MTDRFSILPLDRLLIIILKQYDGSGDILGIPKELFFNPESNDTFQIKRFGSILETPIGVAAGPQTQLAQNIVAAWLTGARFIELKTIQTLDELEISKPCIDMQDEGYNCEWSQELKIKESFDQYLNAWIIIHILRDKFNQDHTDEPGVIFNMSVGYDYQGILKNNVQWFFNKMADAFVELEEKMKSIKSIYPDIVNLTINPCISDNITLSTMHGCPAGEIETIGEYLIENKKLHTAIKLNPTLLGKEKLDEIMGNSGFETQVPDIAFEHDLKYEDALNIIKNLQKKADKNQRQFSIKLTNTLESLNNKEVFGTHEEMMYMSGRALHPISITLAHKLQKEFDGALDISFSGGVDAFNVVDVVNCGLTPVTVCTDLLKPGGYGRLAQYIENLRSERTDKHTSTLEALSNYSKKVLNESSYRKTGFVDPSIKTDRKLNYFDCIHPPCVDTCPTNQDIPDYLHYTSEGDFSKAAQVIKLTNPFPHTTGMICDHLCQTKCTRINYDSPVLIREIKRFIAENAPVAKNTPINGNDIQHKLIVSVIGAGPSGLSCAYFLALAGMKVNVYETKGKPGGMVDGAIPSFRLTDKAIDIDINSILELGVNIQYKHEVNKQSFKQLSKNSNYIYIGTGARNSKKLTLPGIDSDGVLDPLDFLFKVKKGNNTGIGNNVVIIGGGNTAMDAARTAYRLVGPNGKVTIVYRRTIKQMPADLGEIMAVLEEGINILELASPIKINTENGHVTSLKCNHMQLGDKDSTGRASPVEISGSVFEIPMDTLIPAIGQETDIDFMDPNDLTTKVGSYETKSPNVFIGGDAMRGASTAINAIGDGRKAAQEIIDKAGIDFNTRQKIKREEQTLNQLMVNKVKRILPQTVVETSLSERKNFNLVSATLTKEEAIKEASRCLLCDEVCNICVTVCPNLAFHSYEITPIMYKLQNVIALNGDVKIVKGNNFEVTQKYQILHIADWCNQCGNCNTFCPSVGAPYLEKPHLYLEKETFDREKDGYFLDADNNAPVLLAYRNNQQYRLTDMNDYKLYETDYCIFKLESATLRIIETEIKEKTNFKEDLSMAAEMSIIMQGAISFMLTDLY